MTPPRLHGDTQLHTQRPQQRGCFVNSVLIPGARNLLCQPAKPGPCNIQGFLVHRKCTNIWSISGIALVEGLEASFLFTRFQGAGHVNSKYFKLEPAKSCLEQQRLPRSAPAWSSRDCLGSAPGFVYPPGVCVLTISPHTISAVEG